MLEWKEEKDSPIPPDLIDRLSRNLFAFGDREERAARHPVHDFTAMLLQRATTVTLPIPGGGTATIGGKALRQKDKGVKDGDE